MAYGAGNYWRNRMKGGARPGGMARFGAGRFGSPRKAWWRAAPARSPLKRIWRRAALQQMLRLTERRLGWANASSRLLSDFREQIAAALEQEGGADNGLGFADEGYDAAAESIDTAGTSVEPPPPDITPPDEPDRVETPTGASPGSRRVTTRGLNKMFEEWEARGGRPTRDNYPRIDDINAELRQEGYEEASAETIRKAYDRWVEGGGADDELEKPTRGDIFEAFDAVVGRDVTSQNMPYVKDINKQLEREGYAGITKGELEPAYRLYMREHKKRARVRTRR